MKVSILTVSDRSAAGKRDDASGPVLRSMVTRQGWEIVAEEIVSDNPDEIKEVLIRWVDQTGANLILTTGGTGLGPRDNTPEATIVVCDRLAPGFSEAMRAASLKITPHAMLSRAVAGTRDKTLIVNLPGSPKGAKENLEVIMPALKHAVQVLVQSEAAESGHQHPEQRKQL